LPCSGNTHLSSIFLENVFSGSHTKAFQPGFAEILRPALNNSGFLKTLSGCFPNFIAAYFISLAFVSAVLIRRIKHGRLVVYISSIAVFIILMIEELKPMWGASTYYDTFDIIASALGSIFTIITYELLKSIERKRKAKNSSHYNNELC